jgi:hypothetical protein
MMKDGWAEPRAPKWGQPLNEADDFTFSVILSDDGFQKDIRKIEKPAVTFENTPLFGSVYYSLSRLPTWRIDVGQKARQIKILPRETERKDSIVKDPVMGGLRLTEIEAYSPDPAEDLAVKAFAADVDADGSNELVVGTSNRQVAVYRSDGKQLWSKSTYPHDVFTMGCDDLDEDGKSDIMVYTTGEKLHRYRGDGSEMQPAADIDLAQRKDPAVGWPRTGGIVAMAAWRPDSKMSKEIALFAQGEFFVTADGQVTYGHSSEARGGARIHGLLPGEPEILAAVNSSLSLWTSKRDANGQHIKLKDLPMTGAGGAACARSFGWVQAVSAGAIKGILAANEGGVNWFPLASLLTPVGAAFKPDGKEKGWGFDTGGVPVVAALAEDIDGDGVPEVFLARKDGFVNVYKLADGSSAALLNTGEPILGMAMLKGSDGKPRLAVGTKFSVYLFGADLKMLGSHAMAVPAAAFAGPGGKQKDSVYVVDQAGNVTVLTVR